MREREIRLPCPVCLGATMTKTSITGRDRGGAELVLDHCPRCGGIWFQAHELHELRRSTPDALFRVLAPRTAAVRPRCHACEAFITRTDSACRACGARNLIACPSCDQEMRVTTHDGVQLDACRSCHGVWFDRAELDAIWRVEIGAAVQRHGLAGTNVGAEVADAAVYFLIDSPGLTIEAAKAGARLLGQAPETVHAVVQVAGESAAGVFEAVVEIIGGVFG